MEFLYGDSTPSPLTSNFLEFLRDAIDFGVYALHVDDEIAVIRERTRVTNQAADDEIAGLEALGRAVATAVGTAAKSEADSETSRCAAQLTAMSADAVAAAVAAVRLKLDGQRAALATEEAAQRDACFRALESLLMPHSPPESTVSVLLQRAADRTYSAWRMGETRFGLRWRVDLSVPQGHAFARELPMERLAPHVEIHAPEQAGWLKKEVKLKALRLDRFVLREVLDDGATVTLQLRNDGSGANGLDFEVDPRGGKVSASRAGASDDPSAGAFELPEEDVAKLVAMAEKVRAAVGELTATRLAEATLGNGEVKQEPTFAGLVEQLIASMAPLVQEVARHSLNTTELVLRRTLSKERREEIFVAKSTLREKFLPLRPELRAIFGRLGLETLAPPSPSAPSRLSSPPTPEENDWPPARAELPRSDPPPPLTSSSRPPPR
jgi:hypothetical protein